MFPADLPARPWNVSVAAGLLLGSAAILLIGWAVWPETVVSNGARVFFVMLWGLMAYAAHRGLGWVRLAIGLVFLASAWGVANAESVTAALLQTATPELLCSVMQVAALVLLCFPAARRWFAAVREMDAAQ